MAPPFMISHQEPVERSDVFEIFPEKIGSYIFNHEHRTSLKQLCFYLIDKYYMEKTSYFGSFCR